MQKICIVQFALFFSFYIVAFDIAAFVAKWSFTYLVKF